jgi:undecaprenyl-diphosphatase
MRAIIEAALLGLVEALTEFLPVSSTGHLIIATELLGFEGPPGKIFEVVIQAGAILAVLLIYFQRFWNVALNLRADPGARRFVAAIALAFLPAAVIGVLAHKYIKFYLFNSTVIAIALILGGIAMLVIERLRPVPRVNEIEAFTPKLAFGIGLIQCVAMIPGVSRSGATILGALLLGVTRRAAAEFSFFLAVPTLGGAAVYDLYKGREALNLDGLGLIGVGFVVAFLASLWVIRWFVGFVSRHGFAPFAWYRIVAGLVLLAAIWVF